MISNAEVIILRIQPIMPPATFVPPNQVPSTPCSGNLTPPLSSKSHSEQALFQKIPKLFATEWPAWLNRDSSNHRGRDEFDFPNILFFSRALVTDGRVPDAKVEKIEVGFGEE